MTYVRAQGTVVVSDCPGAAPSGMGAHGASVCSGFGRRMGMAGFDPRDPMAVKIAELQLEINRFTGPAVTSLVRVSDTPLAVTGTYDQATPVMMVAVLMKRAGVLAHTVPPDMRPQMLVDAQRWGMPEYALSHLDEGITTLRQYAASKGLPPAAPMPGTGVIGRLMALGTTEKVLIAGGVAMFLLTRKRGRR